MSATLAVTRAAAGKSSSCVGSPPSKRRTASRETNSWPSSIVAFRCDSPQPGSRSDLPAAVRPHVNLDNTVSFQNLILQIEAVRCRVSLAGCKLTVHKHLGGSISLTHGPHRLGRYSARGAAWQQKKWRREGLWEIN